MSNRNRILFISMISAVMLIGGCNKGSGSGKAAIKETKSPGNTYTQVPSVSIQEAALTGQTDMVIKHIESGTDVNSKDNEGRTALMYAAYNGHAEIMRALIRRGADVNIQDNYGRTALMMAASGPFPQAVQLLLDNNANTNIADKEEHYTALMYAAAEGQTENVKILLAYRANPFLKDADGDSAITFARNNKHSEIVKLLQPPVK